MVESGPFLDARHRALTRDAIDWATRHQMFDPSQVEKQAANASTFGYLCRPAACSDRQLWLATSYALLFFYLDDTPAQTIAARLDPADPCRTLRTCSAGAAWLDDHRELALCTHAVREDFERSLAEYLQSLTDERATDPARVTLEEHWQLRRRSVFVDTWIAQWLVSLDFRASLEGDPAQARALCIDLVILSNDLGSLHRDTAAGSDGELNLVHTYARTRSCSEHEAVAAIIADYNRSADELLRIVCGIASDPALASYADLIRGVVDGNLRAMMILAQRYARAQELLAALRPISAAT
jgi:hypothetical protein